MMRRICIWRAPSMSPTPCGGGTPPILIGGDGEQKTLRFVAQYGDACNLFARIGTPALQHKLAVLREHCDRLGRPYAAIEKTTLDSLRLSRTGAGGTRTPAAGHRLFWSAGRVSGSIMPSSTCLMCMRKKVSFDSLPRRFCLRWRRSASPVARHPSAGKSNPRQDVHVRFTTRDSRHRCSQDVICDDPPPT